MPPKPACCPTQIHEHLKRQDLWVLLALVGIQVVEADEAGPAETYEVRNCPCGSTLLRRVID